ncbi:hypothetical protein LTS10_009138 [Elasticomyces elasticus]|nr:hypothetical protein LTS10_009138 [Elasticomyces elasticus]
MDNVDPLLRDYPQNDNTFSNFSHDLRQHAGMAAPQGMPGPRKMISVDVQAFMRTRDTVISSFMTLSSSIDRAVKAYHDHTNTIIHSDNPYELGTFIQPLNALGNVAQQTVATMQNTVAAAPPVATEVKQEEEETKVKGKRKKRAYKPRDPNAPKRPLTAYFRYLGEQRPLLAGEIAVQANGVPQRPGEITKQATARWNVMTEAEQQPYKDAYHEALKEYEVEVAKYKANGGQLSPAGEHPVDVKSTIEAVEEDAAAEDDDDAAEEMAAEVVEEDADAAAEDESDEASSDEDEEEDAKPVMPPPPPTKATPKSTAKKAKAAPQFSSINPSASISASPDRKRKASAAVDAPAPATPAETAPKKRGRKAAADKVTAAADVPAPAPVAQMQATEEPAKKKRKKKGET